MTLVRCKVSVVVLVLLATASIHAQVRTGPLADKIDRIEKAMNQS